MMLIWARRWLAVAGVLSALSAQAGPDLSPARLPADGRREALLTIDQPGAYMISVRSSIGLSLQLIDRMTGPAEPTGETGRRDGRLELLLDSGTYKVITTGPDKADGEASLTVTGFAEQETRPRKLIGIGEASTSLNDLEQRSFWIESDGKTPLFVQMAGRALGQVRFWRDGLTVLAPAGTRSIIEPITGKPLTNFEYFGILEAGLYRITAYGTMPLAWPAGGTETPFYLRHGIRNHADAGITPVRFNHFGSERFWVPGSANYFQIEGKPGETATLSVQGIDLKDGSIRWQQRDGFTGKSRVPRVSLQTPDGQTPVLTTVAGAPGGSVILRHFNTARQRELKEAGDYWIEQIADGSEADRLEPSLILEETTRHPFSLLDTRTLTLDQKSGVRRKFNLDEGWSSLFLTIAEAGPYRFAVSGTEVNWQLAPYSGGQAIKVPDTGLITLEPGIYKLTMQAKGKPGPAELSIGAANGAEPVILSSPAPRFPSVRLQANRVYRVTSNERPGLTTGLVLRRLPIDLATPMVLMLAPAETVTLPIRLGADGIVSAQDETGAALAVTIDNQNASAGSTLRAGVSRLSISNPDKTPKAVSIRFEPAAQPQAAFTPPKSLDLPIVAEKTSQFFDLETGQSKSLALMATHPGFYRIRSISRIKMAGTLASPLKPQIFSAADNGLGHNFSIDGYLREGIYITRVRAEAGAGRVAVELTRPPMQTAGILKAGLPLRTSANAGEGITLTIDIAETGPYDLSVLTPGAPFFGRLEDADGWPVEVPGPISSLKRIWQAGKYRLLLAPKDTAARVLISLTRQEKEQPPSGHGPHPLPLNQTQSFRWLEPETRDAARTPDSWDFELALPSDIIATLGDGMQAELLLLDGSSLPGPVLARFSYAAPLERNLPAGRYRLNVSALGRNNQLDYSLNVTTKQIAASQPRGLTIPGSVEFVLPEEKLVELSSFGSIDVRAKLFDGNGTLIESADDRNNDWNFLLARTLGPGSYRLTVEETPRPQTSIQQQSATAREDTSEETGEEGEGGEEGEYEEGGMSEDYTGTEDAPTDSQVTAPQTIVTLRLPAEVTEPALSAGQTLSISDDRQHIVPISATGDGLALLQASSAAEDISLVLERHDGTAWQVTTTRQGVSPWIALLPDGKAAYRLKLWASSPPAVPVNLRLTQVAVTATALGQAVALTPLSDSGLGVLRLQTGRAGLYRVSGTLLASLSDPNQPAMPVTPGLVAALDKELWLIGEAGGSLSITPADPGGDTPLTFTLPPHGRLAMEVPVQSGSLILWTAEARVGQPGLAAGSDIMAVADRKAVLLTDKPNLILTRADGLTGPMVVTLRRTQVSTGGTGTLEKASRHAIQLKPRSAVSLALASGDKRLTLDLPPQVVGRIGDHGTLWSSERPVSRTLETAGRTVDLLNPTDHDVSVTLAMPPQLFPETAEPGFFRRFIGQGGSISLQIPPGDRPILLAGSVRSALLIGRDGILYRGKRLAAPQGGLLIAEHDAGLITLWREGFMPEALANARRVEIDDSAASLALTGPGRRLFFPTAPAARLVRISTSAPVLMGLLEGEQLRSLMPFDKGASFSVMIPAAGASVALLPTQSGDLSGQAEITITSEAESLREGLNPAITLGPGDARLYRFTLGRDGDIGIGVRGSVDRADSILLDQTGKELGRGVVQLHHLKAGDYYLMVSVPADAPTITVEPALAGVDQPDDGPPPAVQKRYMDLVSETRQ